MSLPKRDYRGRESTISMMEFRSAPGEVADAVQHGMKIHLEKNGKRIATIVPAEGDREVTEILADGSIVGQVPVMFRRNLGNGGY